MPILREHIQESSIRQQILTTASEAIDGARNESYGKPEDSFSLIAKFWSNYLADLGNCVTIKGHDVAVMLILMKIARITKSRGSHYDSWVDTAGYAACGYESFSSANGENE